MMGKEMVRGLRSAARSAGAFGPRVIESLAGGAAQRRVRGADTVGSKDRITLAERADAAKEDQEKLPDAGMQEVEQRSFRSAD
jgi:hypothetical protein